MKLHYSVLGDYRTVGIRDTLAEAEKLARWHAARHNQRFDIEEAKPVKGRWQYRILAVVSRDALGRIWTDAKTMEGLI